MMQLYYRLGSYLGLIFMLAPQAVWSTELANQANQLDVVNGKIKNVEALMARAQAETEVLQAELRKNEKIAGNIAFIIREIEKKSALKTARLQSLSEQKHAREQKLKSHKQALVRQIRAAYVIGKHDYVKLFLNQEDPSRIGLALAYHNYYGWRRAQQVKAFKDDIEAITVLENDIKEENVSLLELKQKQLAKKHEINESRIIRKAILAKLQDKLKQQGRSLQSLQQQEQEIKALLAKLKPRDGVNGYTDTRSFSKLKGKLEWPVRGRLLAHYGGTKRGASLKWQGVVLGAEAGNEVHAISGGKVIFADWFRNLGLLIIIDHGDDYMSLYGYNESLLKKNGDLILPGEVIATAGDSGGQLHPGVYFEIRDRGIPVDPAQWCKR